MRNINDYLTVAMLQSTDEERGDLSKRLETLVSAFEVLDTIDTQGAEPLVSVLNIQNVLREDVPEKNFTRDEILANAPEQLDGFFLVPGTL